MSRLISIIVPIYNVGQYVERCLESIAAQTYENLEIICVDDGSTDGSGQIADRLAGSDARITVFHTEHKGVAAARNLALKSVKGEYIGFVDSDDYISKDMIETLVTAVQRTSVDIVSCSYCLHDSNGIRAAENHKKVPEGIMTTEVFLRYVYERDTYKGVASYIWTKLFKRELIKDDGNNLLIKFPENIDIGEDALFLAEVYKSTASILYVDRPLYYYFQRSDSVSNDTEKHLNFARKQDAYNRLIEIYKAMGVSEDVLDLITRLYVFRCGKLLEAVIKSGMKENAGFLVDIIKENLPIYIRKNVDHVDWVEWLTNVLQSAEELYNEERRTIIEHT